MGGNGIMEWWNNGWRRRREWNNGVVGLLRKV